MAESLELAFVDFLFDYILDVFDKYHLTDDEIIDFCNHRTYKTPNGVIVEIHKMFKRERVEWYQIPRVYRYIMLWVELKKVREGKFDEK